MGARKRGLIIGLSGFVAGFLAASLVDWPTLAKAALAAGVCVVVSLLLLMLTSSRVIE